MVLNRLLTSYHSWKYRYLNMYILWFNIQYSLPCLLLNHSNRTTPFILSLLIDATVEIHDEMTLCSLQRISAVSAVSAGQQSINILTSLFSSSGNNNNNTSGSVGSAASGGINTTTMMTMTSCLTSFSVPTAATLSKSGTSTQKNNSDNNVSRVVNGARPLNAVVCAGGDSGLCLLQLVTLTTQVSGVCHWNILSNITIDNDSISD